MDIISHFMYLYSPFFWNLTVSSQQYVEKIYFFTDSYGIPQFCTEVKSYGTDFAYLFSKGRPNMVLANNYQEEEKLKEIIRVMLESSFYLEMQLAERLKLIKVMLESNT